MGAIWDFIAGKSNDWDRVEREQSSSSSSGNYSSRKRKRIGAYCKNCGHKVQDRFSDSIDNRATLIRECNRYEGGCGEGLHNPVIVEVEE